MRRFTYGLLILLFFPWSSAFAATLYIDPGIATLYRGDAVTASVRIMPDQSSGECINAADVVISYPPSVQPVDVSIGRSIFSVWVEDPIINKETRTITFAGGVPNGYCGRVQGDPSLTNVLADIVFRSPGLQIGVADTGSQAIIEFAPGTQVFLNDGQGTPAPLTTLPSTLTLESTVGAELTDEWREAVRSDNIPPESFSISLERDPVAFAGEYFIVFSTSDKQTGLSHYEVMEEPIAEFGRFAWGRADAPWIRTMSPYVLKDQSLHSTIRVRAFDKAGNEYVATLVPDPSLQTLSKQTIMTIGFLGSIFVVTLVMLGALFVWWMRRQAAKREESVQAADIEPSDEIV